MIVMKPTVGPIVGWTTVNSVRLWARGECSSEFRTFGVARIRESKSGSFGTTKVFKMMPTFDFTGIVDFGSLSTNQLYEYQIGYLFANGELDEIKIDESYDWNGAVTGYFRTAVSNSTPDISFVFGSCRYLLRFLGGSVFDNRGDKTFRSINQQVDNGKSTDLLLMVGDQIYADDLRVLIPDDQLDEFWSRYRKVFGQTHIQKLMGRIPTYMILDDHEISDDWNQDRYGKERDLYAAAIHAYECYQFVHSPGFQPLGHPDRSDTPQKLWYKFRHGMSEFFVMDTRTERRVSAKPPQIIGPEQMDSLKEWLDSFDGTTKFVITSVPFFPDLRSGSRDKWSGFNHQRVEILDFIYDKGISKVIFLSGDVHCSMVGQLKCTSDPNFSVTSIISSSFFWPYPQGRAWQFNLEGNLCTGKFGTYTLSDFETVYSEDNFTRVSTTLNELTIEFYERKGFLLECRKVPL